MVEVCTLDISNTVDVDPAWAGTRQLGGATVFDTQAPLTLPGMLSTAGHSDQLSGALVRTPRSSLRHSPDWSRHSPKPLNLVLTVSVIRASAAPARAQGTPRGSSVPTRSNVYKLE